jgi:signal transduction histidine kinase
VDRRGSRKPPVPALETVGLVLATVPLAVVVHLVLAFPSGRLRDGLARATVLAAYFVSVVLQAPSYLFGVSPDGSTSILHVADRRDLARLGHWVQHGVGAAVMVAAAAILVSRLRRASPEQRRVLAPLYFYAVAAVLWVPLSRDVEIFAPWTPYTRSVTQLCVFAGIPVAFAVVLLLGGFARTTEVDELGAWLGAEDGGRPELADALGDPSLELAFWDATSGGYVDAAGTSLDLAAVSPDRASAEVMVGVRKVGAIVYDATLIADPELVREAGRVVALALDRERLTAELRASRARLRVSRARVVHAADAERRRIARDLHDGLQTRLVVLAMKANSARADASASSAARASAAELQAGIESAIRDLRELVQGVVPATLMERGLCAAVEDLADRLPIAIKLELDAARARLPAPIESTGYFVVSEALTNALKHAHAHEVRVRVARTDGRLSIKVGDDGVGGARIGEGAGLRGMADRVEALDGRLRVVSVPGAGTQVVAEVPCES